MKTNNGVLITGVFNGIGLDLAREFAKNGHPLVITASTKAELETEASKLRDEFKIEVHPIVQDFIQPYALHLFYESLKAQNLPIDILINNAEVEYTGNFWESLDHQIEMIRLNAANMVSLTGLILQEMLSKGYGRILNTTSLSGFIPSPQMAVYHATKAFILSFSESLAAELKGTGIFLTTLCLNVNEKDYPIEDKGEASVLHHEKISTHDLAQGVYQALLAGEKLFVPGGLCKTMTLARHLNPESLLIKMTDAVYAEPEDILPH